MNNCLSVLYIPEATPDLSAGQLSCVPSPQHSQVRARHGGIFCQKLSIKIKVSARIFTHEPVLAATKYA